MIPNMICLQFSEPDQLSDCPKEMCSSSMLTSRDVVRRRATSRDVARQWQQVWLILTDPHTDPHTDTQTLRYIKAGCALPKT